MYLVVVTSVMLDIVVAYLLYRSADCAYVYLSCAVALRCLFTRAALPHLWVHCGCGCPLVHVTLALSRLMYVVTFMLLEYGARIRINMHTSN